MNVFGQVWLWTLLAFAVGVLLTWFVMVRPARRQVADLEDQLLEARSRSLAPVMAPAVDDDLERDFEAAQWHDTPSRSLTDEVLTPAPHVEPPAPYADAPYAEQPAPYSEPPAYFGEPVTAPEAVEESEPEPVLEPEAPAAPLMSSEEAQRRFEEQLAEQKAIADSAPTEDDRPRSLFERLSPDAVPEETPAEMTAVLPPVLPRSGLEAADFDDEPELPAEQTSFVPAYEPTAEVAPPAAEPTAGPEVDEHVEDFIYEPREVWAEEEQEAFLDEAAEQEDEPVRSTASEQTTFIAVTESSWPANDLTGEYPALRDELAERLDNNFTEPETAADRTQLVEPVDLDAPHVRNGVFEPAQDTFTEPEAESEPASPAQTDYELAQHQAHEPESAQAEPDVFEHEPAHAQHERYEPQPEAFEQELAQAQVYEPHAQPEVFEPETQHQVFEQEPAHAQPEVFDPQAPLPQRGAFEQDSARSHAQSEPFQPTAFGAPVSAGEFHAFGDTTDTLDREPQAVAAAFDHPVEAPPAPPQPPVDRPRSLFEPLLDADEPLPALGQTRQLPEPTNDQPFVPTFVPSDEPLLAAAPEPEPEPIESDLPQRVSEAGLPIREARRTTMQRQQSFPAFQAFEAPKPEAPPAPALPSRPRPVGFSPSTGGRPNGTAPAGSSSRFQQPEGFNPRSPFGPGSVLPRSDGLAPAQDFSVKATLTGRRYYTSASANFVETRADVWFRTETDAQKAGFRPAP